jgi:nucleoside-diphosphate-sugar epimerase
MRLIDRPVKDPQRGSGSARRSAQAEVRGGPVDEVGEVRVVGDAHQPHTWTDVRDMGRALVAVAGTESALGRVWHAHSNAPRTQAEAVNDVLASAGSARSRCRPTRGRCSARPASSTPSCAS